jgi:hypothetical protein
MTLYEVLRLQPNASAKQIDSAYRILASELHPDVNPSPSAAGEFKLLKAAYEILSDPSQRSAYDAQLMSRARNVGTATEEPQASPRPRTQPRTGGSPTRLSLHLPRMSFRRVINGVLASLVLAFPIWGFTANVPRLRLPGSDGEILVSFLAPLMIALIVCMTEDQLRLQWARSLGIGGGLLVVSTFLDLVFPSVTLFGSVPPSSQARSGSIVLGAFGVAGLITAAVQYSKRDRRSSAERAEAERATQIGPKSRWLRRPGPKTSWSAFFAIFVVGGFYFFPGLLGGPVPPLSLWWVIGLLVFATFWLIYGVVTGIQWLGRQGRRSVQGR